MNLKVRNQAKISAFFPTYRSSEGLDKGIRMTEHLFTKWQEADDKNERKKKRKWLLSLLVTRAQANGFSRPAAIEKRPLLEVDWQPLLFAELGTLKDEAEEVSVLDYGADPEGKIDSTLAFKRAMRRGGRIVYVPKGTFLISGLKVPSNTAIIGAGEELTTLLLIKETPKKRQGIRNRNLFAGNKRIRLEGFTLNWDSSRFGESERSASGGTSSSGITLAHVQFALIRKVKVLNAGLHGVDVTSAFYSYRGDGTTSRFRSAYVWIDQVEAAGFGDDGVTTHHSDFIYISHCFLHDPSGRAHEKGFSNSNGIEVDDGSRHVVLHNNATENCFGGVEIKAHETSSAAYDTQIIGHISSSDNRSFNFRHIGHHKGEDEESQTATGIRATFLIAELPVSTPLYMDSEPRALVISAYKKVSITHFLVVDEKHTQILAIQYRASQVAFDKIYYKGKKPEVRLGKETHDVNISEIKQWSGTEWSV
ncbi:glycosyl hydrolase family 28-related protein [Listeria aquatica]